MFFKYNLPSIVWGLLILYVLCLPGGQLPRMPLFQFPQFDKIIHTGLFTIFSFLLSYGFIKQERFKLLKQMALLFVIFISVSWGGATEYAQYLFVPTREASWADFGADVVGTATGIIGMYVIRIMFHKKEVESISTLEEQDNMNHSSTL